MGRILQKADAATNKHNRGSVSCPSATHVLPGFKTYAHGVAHNVRIHCTDKIKDAHSKQTFQCDEYPPAGGVVLDSKRDVSTMCIPARSNGAGGSFVQRVPLHSYFTFKTHHSQDDLLKYCMKWVSVQTAGNKLAAVHQEAGLPDGSQFTPAKARADRASEREKRKAGGAPDPAAGHHPTKKSKKH
ncbi:hypothetical protein HDU97_001371 [Phlyctochytrium planicorne]|nr:hypothetical protein HDU97_001371 [Phlyctochytrium planicorne]